MSAAPKLNISAAAAEDADDEASPNPSHSQLLPVLSKAIEDFGLELLHRLESKELDERREKTGADPKNLFISPLSLSTVLGVVLVGAAGDTYREIKRALG